MGSIVYNPSMKLVTTGVTSSSMISMVESTGVTQEIADAIQIAVSQAIQESIVIPLKVFIVDSWVVMVEISKWGCIFGYMIGGAFYLLGDDQKGKKMMCSAIIIQIIIQMLNYIFVG